MMKFLLVLGCFLPVLLAKPASFFGSSMSGTQDPFDWSSDEQHDCAEHLRNACVEGHLSPPLSPEIQPSFETCRVFDFMNCLEREINATTQCHHSANINHTRIRSVQFNFDKAKKCPCTEDFGDLIDMLIYPDLFTDPDIFVVGNPDDDEDEDWSSLEGDHHEEGGHDGDYSDLFGSDNEDHWVGKGNATAPSTGEVGGDGDNNDDEEENGTKTALQTGKIDAMTSNETHANDTDDSFHEEMDGFVDGLADVLDGADNWDDWEEDNEDDSHYGSANPTDSDSYGDHGETGHDDSMTDHDLEGHDEMTDHGTSDNHSSHLFDSSYPESSTHEEDSIYQDAHDYDINRRVVKQTSASFCIPELEFESEAFSQKGVLTTIEGILQNAIDGLEQQQIVRRALDPETASKIDDFIKKLKTFQRCEASFTFEMEDITGNSFIENPFAPNEDPATVVKYFTRSQEQDRKLGIYEEEATVQDEKDSKENEKEDKEEGSNKIDLQGEVLQFNCNCSHCNSPAITKMKVLQIPNFKEVVVMASDCDKCGFRSNEVKAGGGIEPYGIKLSLKMTDVSDLNRDVLKSETCYVMIPELDFEMQSGSIGGKFTTVEGLLVSIKEELERGNPFSFGDSADVERKQKMTEFLNDLDEVISGKKLVTLVLDDPIGNSFIQNFYAPEPDPELQVEKYERTFEQNEQFGLNDIDTS